MVAVIRTGTFLQEHKPDNCGKVRGSSICTAQSLTQGLRGCGVWGGRGSVLEIVAFSISQSSDLGFRVVLKVLAKSENLPSN